MTATPRTWPRQASLTAVAFATLLAACGGDDDGTTAPPPAPGLADVDAACCNGTAYEQVGHPVTAAGAEPVAGVQDIQTVRVHYRRADGNFAAWGLHLWNGSGLDVSRLPAGTVIENWNAPVPLTALPGYAATATEAVFEIPVLNPQADATRTALKFVLHGLGANVNEKDGWSNDVSVDFQAAPAANGVLDVWMVSGQPKVYPTEASITQVSLATAAAVWLDDRLLQWPGAAATSTFKLYHSKTAKIAISKGQPVAGADGAVALAVGGTAAPAVAERFKYVGAGPVLAVADADLAAVGDALAGQVVLVAEDADGKVIDATETQVAGALDTRHATATAVTDLGATVAGGATTLKVWAPTAQKVRACVFDSGSGDATAVKDLTRDAATGVWTAHEAADLSGKYYTYLVDVYARGTGVVRNRVTDPYAVSLTTDSARTYIADLASPALKPAGWDTTPAPSLPAQVDMSIYELHVRDFSVSDETVPAAHRGKYLAFTDTASNGMKHLKGLADAGLTDVHLLPVYDLGSVPETGCRTPALSAGVASDSPAPRDAVKADADGDCFNWGYDPYHYTAPEGSYATDPADGARRIVEFRQMVNALHAAGLRVGMDVVYNHTFRHGQSRQSVLDRIVPGYYHRLNADGQVEESTCCSNTATENAMMGKLMIDSVRTWATQYKIDSFRFDLMGHQPRAVMERLKADVDAAAGRPIFLVGEGWNFGEVANGARFVQASQLSLNGSGIATFSDRARDRIRGGGCCDDGADFKRQGYVSGLFYDPNATSTATAADLLEAADMVRVGLAGSLRSFAFETADGTVKAAEALPYGADPAGYVSQPGEVVNYYENHDNRTLWDALAAKMPVAATLDDRVRAQTLAAAINSFSQGIAYFHAGADVLRSKSMDSNSYNSGDWFNRLDWTYASNNFGVGLPVTGDEDLAKEVLVASNLATMKPGQAEIVAASGMFRDLLAIRSSSTLFRLRTADEVSARLRFLNTGTAQVPTVLAGHLDGNGHAGAGFREVLYLVNVDKVAHTLTFAGEANKAYTLHPVHVTGTDRRPATQAAYAAASGTFTVPARTAVVYVVAE